MTVASTPKFRRPFKAYVPVIRHARKMTIIAKITIAEQKMKHLLQHMIMTNTRIRQE
jgi:hypothetical protein